MVYNAVTETVHRNVLADQRDAGVRLDRRTIVVVVPQFSPGYFLPTPNDKQKPKQKRPDEYNPIEGVHAYILFRDRKFSAVAIDNSWHQSYTPDVVFKNGFPYVEVSQRHTTPGIRRNPYETVGDVVSFSSQLVPSPNEIFTKGYWSPSMIPEKDAHAMIMEARAQLRDTGKDLLAQEARKPVLIAASLQSSQDLFLLGTSGETFLHNLSLGAVRIFDYTPPAIPAFLPEHVFVHNTRLVVEPKKDSDLELDHVA